MLNKMKMAIAIPLVSIFVSPMTTHAKNDTAEWCEQQWRLESAKVGEQNVPDYQNLLKRWQQYEQKCAGTVSYEARLAITYLFLNQPDKAREVLKPFAMVASEYRYLVDFSLLQADAADMTSGIIKLEDVRRLEEKYKNFIKKYPDFPDAYAVLGGLQTSLDKHTEAIRSLEIGLRSSMDVSGVYRNLTLSYSAVGRYQDAVGAADKAFQLNKQITSDRYFLFALAKADAGIGNFHVAESIVKLIAAKFPDARRDPEFQKTVDFVMSRPEAKTAK